LTEGHRKPYRTERGNEPAGEGADDRRSTDRLAA